MEAATVSQCGFIENNFITFVLCSPGDAGKHEYYKVGQRLVHSQAFPGLEA